LGRYFSTYHPCGFNLTGKATKEANLAPGCHEIKLMYFSLHNMCMYYSLHTGKNTVSLKSGYFIERLDEISIFGFLVDT
jgi:hypothetical protein